MSTTHNVVSNPAKRNTRLVWGLLALIVLVGFLLRLPYWEIIPAPDDEQFQSIVALEIANGTELPLVGNDSYAGPFYFYLLAALIRLGFADPFMGRIIAIITGTLTIPLTYLWVKALGDNKTAALIAALLVAINPYLIVINSHMGGTTYLLPFLSVLFFWCLTMMIKQDHRGWLVATAVSAGLVIQVNPVGALVLLGGCAWGAWQMRKLPKLGARWPLWPVLLGLGIILMYSPVIIYNLGTDLDSVAEVQERSYLWETDPTVQTFTNNMRRLSLQLVRQQSGVLRGGEDFATLLGFPLLYLVLSLLGFFFTTRKISVLPLLLVLPFLFIFPYFSSHYGFSIVTRFTTLLIPVFTAVIGLLLTHWVSKIKQSKHIVKSFALILVFLVLIAGPLLAIRQYYAFVLEENQSAKVLLDITKEMVAQNQGEPVYISTLDEIPSAKGKINYLPHNFFTFAGIQHEYLPAEQILGRLYTNSGPTFFLISDNDAAALSQFIPLTSSSSEANQAVRAQNFGFYTFDGRTEIPKPDIVIGQDAVPNDIAPTAVLEESLHLLGCTDPIIESNTQTLNLTCYWQLRAPLPEKTYVGFAHLIETNSATLVAQDDHILGQEEYPLNAWQPKEVVQETYRLNIGGLANTGLYEIMLGVYSWPDLTRLNVPDQPENIIKLPPFQLDALANK